MMIIIMIKITAVMIAMIIIMITAVCGRCLSLQPALVSPLNAIVWKS